MPDSFGNYKCFLKLISQKNLQRKFCTILDFLIIINGLLLSFG